MSSFPRCLLLLGLLPLAGCASRETQAAPDGEAAVPLYTNLGSYHAEISSKVPLAQQYFDQGMRLYYAFNHAESIRAFDESARLDPSCAICHWGTALAYGPNINVPMDSASGVAAYEASRRALALQDKASPREQALIAALATRYVAEPAENRASLDSNYARAMKAVVDRYPDDLEARTLYAEALMDLSPWEYWDRKGGARPDTPALLASLEHVLNLNPNHPGANHFYIHAVEAVDPGRALPMAERLAGLMPGAGHIVHMPGHIYIRVGRYEDAVRANEHAVHADETYIQDHNPAFGTYTVGYYPHNYDFLAFAASMMGRTAQTTEAAEKLATLATDEMLAAPGMTFLQHHRTRHLQMKVRFNHWEEILRAPAPPEELRHAHAMWRYARGRALAARGEARAANMDLEAVRAAAKDSALAQARLEFNSSASVLSLAAEVLAGHIAAARGEHARAIMHLRKARDMEDDFVYGEPPEWSIPVRQELGAILLAAGRAREAEETFREDLLRFPENGWSLKGLAQSLAAQGKIAESELVDARFNQTWRRSDIEAERARRAAQQAQ